MEGQESSNLYYSLSINAAITGTTGHFDLDKSGFSKHPLAESFKGIWRNLLYDFQELIFPRLLLFNLCLD